MRKRYIAIFMCICLLFTMSGCKSDAETTRNEDTGMISETSDQSDITGTGTESEKAEAKTETDVLPTEPGYNHQTFQRK